MLGSKRTVIFSSFFISIPRAEHVFTQEILTKVLLARPGVNNTNKSGQKVNLWDFFRKTVSFTAQRIEKLLAQMISSLLAVVPDKFKRKRASLGQGIYKRKRQWWTHDPTVFTITKNTECWVVNVHQMRFPLLNTSFSCFRSGGQGWCVLFLECHLLLRNTPPHHDTNKEWHPALGPAFFSVNRQLVVEEIQQFDEVNRKSAVQMLVSVLYPFVTQQKPKD